MKTTHFVLAVCALFLVAACGSNEGEGAPGGAGGSSAGGSGGSGGDGGAGGVGGSGGIGGTAGVGGIGGVGGSGGVAPVCGDGILDEEHEECDGDTVPVSCADHGFPNGETACTDTCTIDLTDCRPAEDCELAGDEDGDGFADCDDPDCSAAFDCPTCGNGILQAGEACDRENIPSTCMDQGFDLGALRCTGNCQFDTFFCRDIVCGDGRVEDSETCDDGNTENGDGCSSDCIRESDSCALPADLNAYWDSLGASALWQGQTTIDFASDFPRPSCGDTTDQPDAVATFIAPATGTYELTIDAEFRGVIWSWNGTCSTPSEELGCQAFTPNVVRPYFFLVDLGGGEALFTAIAGSYTGTTAVEHGEFELKVEQVVCGDGRIDGFEVCDDGNLADGDGCSAACRLAGDDCSEPFDLNSAWEPTQEAWGWFPDVWSYRHDYTASCGVTDGPDTVSTFTAPRDGRYEFVAGSHSAGGTLSIRDACGSSGSELACVTVAPGGGLPAVVRTMLAGDTVHLVADRPAVAWRGNLWLYAFEVICGDGWLNADEECDDDNTVDGDGCSSTCTIEPAP